MLPTIQRFLLSLTGLLLLVLPVFAQAPAKLIARGAQFTQVATGYTFTEGPAADRDGNVYFTDQPNNRILRWDAASNTVSVYLEPSGRANGLYVDHQGNLLACADENNQLWRISPDKQTTVLVSDVDGKKLNGPNDLWVDPRGGIYFTDPFYKRDYWTRTAKEIEQEMVYYLAPAGQLRVVADGFVRPNGIIGTPDGRTLYVADIGAGKTYRYQIGPDGSLTGKTLFTGMGSDGMTIDRKGNVYLTGKGVTVFNPAGEQIAHFPVDEGWTANVCFGGEKGKTLFITASKSVYTLAMRVKGGGSRKSKIGSRK